VHTYKPDYFFINFPFLSHACQLCSSFATGGPPARGTPTRLKLQDAPDGPPRADHALRDEPHRRDRKDDARPGM